MDERLATLLADLRRGESLSPAELQRCERRGSWFSEFPPAQFAEFLSEVGRLPLPLAPAADRLLGVWLAAAVHARRQALARGESSSDSATVSSAIAPLYRELGKSSRARGQLLARDTLGLRVI